ncbi:IclR family transcriptional regulator [Puniceibacterium sp. HSS470]|nr:IclR family transcriptional regulator [Puniceibacterium sp. HSS470]
MDDTPKTPPEPKVDSTLSKGLLILEALAAAPEARGVTDLSRDLGLTKSNVFRLLQTLTTLGYVRHTPDKLYRATLKTWQVGRSVVEGLSLRDLAALEMQMLSRETGEAVYLAVPEGLFVVYVDKIESRQPIRTWNPIGGTAPIHAVSTGKAILAADYATYRPQLTGALTRYTDQTLTDFAALEADLSRARKQGYAVDTGEFRDRVLGFAAPIHLPDGAVIAAIGISLPDMNLAEGDSARLGALVRTAGRAVTDRLRAT